MSSCRQSLLTSQCDLAVGFAFGRDPRERPEARALASTGYEYQLTPAPSGSLPNPAWTQVTLGRPQ